MKKNYSINSLSSYFPLLAMLLCLAGNATWAQTTINIVANGTTGSFNTGSVNSAGVKNDGNMTTINSSSNRGWAKFDLSTIPNGAVISAASVGITTYTSTLSTAANNIYGFTGDPALIAGATLYTNCGSGASFNNLSWAAAGLQTFTLNAAGITFVQTNAGNANTCLGFVRGSTNSYNIYGYPGAATERPVLNITYTVPTPCTGTPTPGNTVSNANPACSNQPITLSLQNTPATSANTYQWQTSPNGTTWTNVPTGGTLPTYTLTQTVATWYRCIVTCTASSLSANSTPLQVTQNAPNACYCVPASTTTGYYVNNFSTTGGVTNITNNGTGDWITSIGYSNYSATKIMSQLPGSAVNFSSDFGASGYTFGAKIWVDWDQDGAFNNTNEIVYSTSGYVSSISGSFTVPLTATYGNTRMRIRIDYNNSLGPDPCAALAFGQGEAEDYTFTVITPTACSGTPAPGNTLCNTIPACANAPITLSNQNAFTTSGITYQWQTSPNGTTWTNVPTGGTGPTYTLTQTVTTWYRCQVTCTNSSLTGTSTPLMVTQGLPNQCYCVPASTTTGYYVNNFSTTGGVTNITNNGSGDWITSIGYSNYSGTQSMSQLPGSTVNFSAAFGAGSNTFGARIWVDWNQDGSFNNTNEMVYTTSSYVNTITGSFTVPLTAVYGNTRMRIRIDYNNSAGPDPCTALSFGQGEAEDYTFNVIAPAACAGTPAPGNTLSNTTLACTNAPITLSFQNAFTTSGITYQWQTSPNGTTWTNVITGGTAPTYTLTQTVTTWYRCIVTCTNSSLSGTSTPLMVTQGLPNQCYCIPSATSAGYYVNNFATTGGTTNITNTNSGAGTTSIGYSNFSGSQTVTAAPGTSVSFSSSFGSSTTYTFGGKVWVDWNQDGDFNDAGEAVFTTTSYVSSMAGTFAVPGTAVLGTTRLRVRIDYNNSAGPDPCLPLSFGQGEAEDYAFVVAPPPPCTGTPVPGNIVTYTPLALTGFTSDVIANGIGAANVTTTSDVDGGGYYFLDSTYRYTAAVTTPPVYALPSSGVIASLQTPGLTYQLRSADSTNSLRLTTTTPATLTLSSPISANALYLLATSGSGASTISVTVNFTNSTSQSFTGINVNDWFGGTPFELQGIGRINATNVPDGTATNPRLYQVPLAITAANQALQIASITVTRTSTSGFLNVMAVSAAATSTPLACAGTTPVLRLLNPPVASGITYQWQQSATSGGPYVDVTGGTGATTTTYTTAAVTSTQYYVCKVICGPSSLSALTNQIAVNISPAPTVSIATVPTNATICGTGNVALTASGTGVSYSWTPATGLSSTTIANPIASPTATTTYTVTARSAAGCSSTATQTVTVNPAIVVSISPAAPSAICSGDSVTLTANGATTYSWSPTAGLSNSNSASVKASPSATTTYTVTGTNPNGCSATATHTVTVNAAPTLSLLPATAITLCAGDTATLTASGADTLKWSPATGLDVILGGIVKASPATTTTYTLTGVNANGCSATLTKTINVNARPTVSISPATATTVCAGTAVPLTASGALTYTWTPTTYLSPISGATVTSTPNATVTYVVTGTDANGCSDTATKLITVNARPVITFTPANAGICAGGSVAITAGGASTYTWSPATGLNTTTGATVTANPVNTTTYTVTGTSLAGCVTTTTKQVVVTPIPTVSITPTAATTVCAGTAVNLTANGAAAYSWSPSTGLSATTGATVTATPLTTTTYTVIGTTNGCTNTATKLIAVNPLPAAAISAGGTTNFCQGGSVILSATTGTGLTYNWRRNGTSLGVTTATYSATTTGNYDVIISNGICPATSNAISVIVSTPPTPAITTTGSASICQGTTVLLSTDANAGYTYQWKLNGSNIPGANAASYTASTGGDYTVEVTNGTCVVLSAIRTITVNALPPAAALPQGPTTFCEGGAVTMFASISPVAAYNYQWSRNAVNIPGATTTNYIATTSGDYAVIVADANCSATSVPVTVIVNPVPPMPVITASGNVLTTGNFVTYQWYRDGILIPGATGQTYTATRDGDYAVLVTNFAGCDNLSAVTTISSVGVAGISGTDIQVYPNPATDEVHIKSTIVVNVTILSVDGKELLHQKNVKTLRIGHLADGLYILRLTNSQGQLIRNERLNKLSR